MLEPIALSLSLRRKRKQHLFSFHSISNKQSRKQNLTPEKEKDHVSRNMLILMEQYHNAACRIWSSFRMLAMIHFPQFLC